MTPHQNAVTLATLNVVSLTSLKRKHWLADLLNEKKIDVAFLQETKIASREDAQNFVRFFGHQFWCFYTLTPTRAGGTAILIRKHNFLTVIDCELAKNGRFCTVDVLVGEELTRFVCVYAPNDQATRADFFASIRDILVVPGRLVLAGDFNCVVNSSDRAGAKRVVDKSARVLKTVLRDGDLIDVALQRGWSTTRYTRWRGTSQARLDRVYLTGDALPLVIDYAVTPVAFSDHGLVTCTIKTELEIRRKVGSRWLMNTMLLDNAAFADRVTGEI